MFYPLHVYSMVSHLGQKHKKNIMGCCNTHGQGYLLCYMLKTECFLMTSPPLDAFWVRESLLQLQQAAGRQGGTAVCSVSTEDGQPDGVTA